MTGRRYYLTTLADWRRHASRFATSHWFALEEASELQESARVLALVEADEGVHLALEDDAAFEPLPHPLAHKALPESIQRMLAPLGVLPGATTFDASEALAASHPLLRHRVF